MDAARPNLTGTFGMVSSTHWMASAAGMAMLERGGNAADGAVAAGLVLQVVEPHLNGPGGDLPLIIASVDDPRPQVLCGQGPAPAAATPQHFADLGLDRVPGSGPLATAVPGALEAWLVLLRDRGTMSFEQVAGPAMHYARHGHPVLERASATIETVRELFEQDWVTSADLWLVGGRAPRPGSLVTNPAWAATLERLIGHERDGVPRTGTGTSTREQRIEMVRRAWSQGFVAEAIDRFARRAFRHSGGQVLPGVITGADLADFQATWEPAVTLDWAGHTIAKTDRWGQGPTLLQVLGMVGRPDLDTPEGVHTVIEAWKLVMADREAWYGDGEPEPVEGTEAATTTLTADLLDPDYLAARAQTIGQEASRELRPGSPGGRQPRVAAQAWAAQAGQAVLAGAAEGEPTVQREGEPVVGRDGVTRGDTCHVDVVDRWGMLVSATPSGGWLQSSPTVPELGLALGSRLQMTWLEQGLVSSLAPRRRPRTTLSPTLVLRDGIPVLACGTPGGDQQDQWQSLFLFRHLGAGADLQESIDAPALHTTSFPGSFYPRAAEPGMVVAESRVGEPMLAELRRRGHEVLVQGPWTLGRMCAVARDPRTGVVGAAANPRGRQGYAVGR